MNIKMQSFVSITAAMFVLFVFLYLPVSINSLWEIGRQLQVGKPVQAGLSEPGIQTSAVQYATIAGSSTVASLTRTVSIQHSRVAKVPSWDRRIPGTCVCIVVVLSISHTGGLREVASACEGAIVSLTGVG